MYRKFSSLSNNDVFFQIAVKSTTETYNITLDSLEEAVDEASPETINGQVMCASVKFVKISVIICNILALQINWKHKIVALFNEAGVYLDEDIDTMEMLTSSPNYLEDLIPLLDETPTRTIGTNCKLFFNRYLKKSRIHTRK